MKRRVTNFNLKKELFLEIIVIYIRYFTFKEYERTIF